MIRPARLRLRLHLPLVLAAAGGLIATAGGGRTTEPEPQATRADCAECHPDEVETFSRGPHGRAMMRSDPAQLDASCVLCHGPAAEHLEEMTAESIVLIPDASACGECHGESSAQVWMTAPAHRRFGVACLDCHASGHEETDAEALLLAAPFETCGECHQSVAASFRLPFAHRDGDEPFACTECHSSHGQTRVARLARSGAGGACLDCHTELAGPHVFPHPPRQLDGCTDCHRAHGSSHPRLLNRPQVLQTCLECHANTPAFHDLTRARFRACTTCHAAIHGSNRDPSLFDD